MRKIKFRLIKDDEIVGYEKHVISVGKVHIFHSIKNDDGYQKDWAWHNVSIQGGHIHYIEHDHKEQFIGFQFEGVEIYEGDWVEDIMNSKDHVGVVEFLEGGFYAEGFDYKGFEELCARERIRPVGNLYDNLNLAWRDNA